MKGFTVLLIGASLLAGCKHPGDTLSFLEDRSKVMTDEQRMQLQRSGQQFGVDSQVVYGYVPPENAAITAAYTGSGSTSQQAGGLNSSNAANGTDPNAASAPTNGMDPNAASGQFNGYDSGAGTSGTNGINGTSGAAGIGGETKAPDVPQTNGTYTTPQVDPMTNGYDGAGQSGALNGTMTDPNAAGQSYGGGYGATQSPDGVSGQSMEPDGATSPQTNGLPADPNETSYQQTDSYGSSPYANGTNGMADPNATNGATTDPNSTAGGIYGYVPPEDPNATGIEPDAPSGGTNGVKDTNGTNGTNTQGLEQTDGVRDAQFELVYNDLMQVMDLEEIGRK